MGLKAALQRRLHALIVQAAQEHQASEMRDGPPGYIHEAVNWSSLACSCMLIDLRCSCSLSCVKVLRDNPRESLAEAAFALARSEAITVQPRAPLARLLISNVEDREADDEASSSRDGG